MASYTLTKRDGQYYFEIFGKKGEISVQIGENEIKNILNEATNPNDVSKGIADEGFNFNWS